MITLTPKEKAARYDALQVAIKFRIDQYKSRVINCPTADEVGTDLIKACKFGAKTAYESVISDLEMWIFEE